MSANPPQGATASQPPSQQPRPYLFRPEQMRALPEAFSNEEKQKWENGLIMLYKIMEKNPPDTEEHLNAKKKVQDFSTTLRGKIQLAKQQAAQNQSQPSNMATSQTQYDGGASNQSTAQQAQGKPTAAPLKPSEGIMNHINKEFTWYLPQQLAAGTPEAIKWLQDYKQRYGNALMSMEKTSAQLTNLDRMVKQRNEQGKPLTENEQKEYTSKKEQWQKQYADAKKYTEGFRKSQDQLKETGAQIVQHGQVQAPNGSGGAPRPTMNLTQQAPNTAQQNTETVNAAIQAAKNQQMHSAQPNGSINGQAVQQNEQISQSVPGPVLNATAQPGHSQAVGAHGPNIKMEGGIQQPQVNTAMASAMQQQQQQHQQNAARQQNSPHSAMPQSATSTGPPRPLSHPAALAQAARTYSSTQTSGTPNVMGGASHAHPSVPRESQNINTNKMPIPKQLPPGAIAPPQPVSMQPSRPTISGGPTNAGSGLMGQPVLQKTPGFNLEGEGERVMNKRKLDELVRQVTGGGEGLDSGEGLTPEVEEVRITDSFTSAPPVLEFASLFSSLLLSFYQPANITCSASCQSQMNLSTKSFKLHVNAPRPVVPRHWRSVIFSSSWSATTTSASQVTPAMRSGQSGSFSPLKAGLRR